MLNQTLDKMFFDRFLSNLSRSNCVGKFIVDMLQQIVNLQGPSQYAQSKMQQSKKITVVEDDPDSLFLIRKVLEKAGYTVECFQDGSHLLDSDNYENPSLFILDNNIGMVDGITVCKYLKAQQKRRSIPIVMMSGSLEFEAIALQSGVDYFLSKPLDMRNLLKIIDSLIATPSAESKVC